MEEEGRASWSGAGGIQLSMANLLWYPHSGGRELWVPHACPALGGGVLCTLETVRDVYWEQGKLFRLGWIRSPEVLCPGTQGCLLVSLS